MTEHETRQRYYEMAIEQLKRAQADAAGSRVSIVRPEKDTPTIIVIVPKAA